MGVRDNGHPPPSVPPKNLLDVKMKDLPNLITMPPADLKSRLPE